MKADLGATVTAVAELSLATAHVSAYAPDMAPDWLKDGDFAALPPQAIPDAAYMRAKYYACRGKYERMLDVAQTALAFYDLGLGILLIDVDLWVVRIIACCSLHLMDEAERYLLSAMNICLPNGFITPFAEVVVSLGGLVEHCLERYFPAHYNAVMRQCERTGANWVKFHNLFTKNDVKIILTLQKYEIALLAARRVPYAKIAQQFRLSPGSIKNIMQTVYGKLNVNNRKELSRFMLER